MPASPPSPGLAPLVVTSTASAAGSDLKNLELAANALLLLAFVPLLAKVGWRRYVVESDSTVYVRRDACCDLALSSQIYSLVASALAYYGSVLSAARKILKTANRVVMDAVGQAKRQRGSGFGRMDVTKFFMVLLSNRRMQMLLVKGLALAASLACAFSLIFGGPSYGPRGGSLGSCSMLWSLLPLAFALGITVALHVLHPDSGGLEGVNPVAALSTFGAALDALAFLPQAFVAKGDSNNQNKTLQPGLATALHFILSAISVALPVAAWWGSSSGTDFLKILRSGDLESLLLPEMISTNMPALLATSSLFWYLIASWNATRGRRWLVAVGVGLAAGLIQVTGAVGPTGLDAFQTSMMKTGSILLQIVAVMALLVVGGHNYLQALGVVVTAFTYFAGLLPNSLDEALRRIKMRYEQLNKVFRGQ